MYDNVYETIGEDMNFDELRYAITTNHFGPDDLDPIVHDVLSQQATEINNGGMDEQLTFLIQRMGKDDILKRLDIHDNT